MTSANSINSDRVFSDIGRFIRSTPFKLLAGIALLLITVLMGATQGQTGTPLTAQYTVTDYSD
jgi:hypothetical protein